MDAATRVLVRHRAGERCEYCLFPQEFAETRHHVDHIRARQHLGGDDPENLALACIHCNSHKGPNLSGIDPENGDLVPLYNPRQDIWGDHFSMEGARIVGLSSIGRATVHVLAMNATNRLNVRAELIAGGVYF